MTAHNISYHEGPAESQVLVMRTQVDEGQGLDRLSTPEIRAVQDQLRARSANPECDDHDRRQAESHLWRSELALRPDYDEHVHRLDCLYVQRYQEGCFPVAGDEPRHFVLVEVSALPGHAVRCEYCFGGRWRPGDPYIPDDKAEGFADWRPRRIVSRRARSKRSVPDGTGVGRSDSVVAPLRPGALALGDTADVVDDAGKAQCLTIVASADARPGEGRLSAASPVGRALLGCVTGDTVTVTTPRGERRLTVRAVSKRSLGPPEA